MELSVKNIAQNVFLQSKAGKFDKIPKANWIIFSKYGKYVDQREYEYTKFLINDSLEQMYSCFKNEPYHVDIKTLTQLQLIVAIIEN